MAAGRPGPPRRRGLRHLGPGGSRAPEQVSHRRRTRRHAVRRPLKEDAHQQRPVRGRPAQFHGRRGQRRVRGRGDGVASGRHSGSAELRGHERPRRGQRVQPERHLGDQPERPRRSGVELAEVVAGDVLDDLPARSRHGAVRQHDRDPDQQVTRRPVAQPPRAGEPGRHHAARRRAGRHVERDLLPGGGERRRDVTHPGARLQAGHQVPGRVLEHRVHPRHVDEHVAPRRCRAPAQPAPAAARHHGQLVLGRDAQHGRRLAGASRAAPRTRAPPGPAPIASGSSAVAHVRARLGKRLGYGVGRVRSG